MGLLIIFQVDEDVKRKVIRLRSDRQIGVYKTGDYDWEYDRVCNLWCDFHCIGIAARFRTEFFVYFTVSIGCNDRNDSNHGDL